MKRIALVLLLVSACSFSQIKVKEVEEKKLIGEVKSGGKFFASIDEYKDHYFFIYQDASYESIVALESFRINKEDFEGFYNIILNGLNEEYGKDISLKFGTLRKMKTVYITKYENGSLSSTIKLNVEFLNKLFGKE